MIILMRLVLSMIVIMVMEQETHLLSVGDARGHEVVQLPHQMVELRDELDQPLGKQNHAVVLACHIQIFKHSNIQTLEEVRCHRVIEY